LPHLKISPEGIAAHFWLVPEDKPAFAIEPDDLDLSDDPLDRIEAWSDAVDAVLDPVDPSATQFASPAAEAVWRAEGHAIAAAIREELGDDWQVEARF